MTHLQGRLQSESQAVELSADYLAQCPQRQMTVALQGLPQWQDAELATLAGQQGHASALLEGYHRHGVEVLRYLHGGFALAMILFAGLREHMNLMQVPKGMRGVPIALVAAGILAMAFMGFAGMVK